MTGYSLCGIAELNEEGSRGVFSFDVAQLERLVVVNFQMVWKKGCREPFEKGTERDRGRPVSDRSNSNIFPSSHKDPGIHLHGKRVDHAIALAG